MFTNTASTVAESVWQIDPALSMVEFSIRHLMVTTLKGHFTGITGTIVDRDDMPSYSAVIAHIDATSLVTGDPAYDELLRSADFFDVAKFPAITFDSRHVVGPHEHFSVTGDLTIHGQTREVTLDVTFHGIGTRADGREVAGFTAHTTICRKDFGLKWNAPLRAGDVLVSDHAHIQMELEAVREEQTSNR
jgi:polyisoprenoid-binding protein YceI